MDKNQIENAVSGVTNLKDKERLRELLTNHVEVTERGTFVDPAVTKEIDEIRGRTIVAKATGRLMGDLSGVQPLTPRLKEALKEVHEITSKPKW
jgi:hypothetical protein